MAIAELDGVTARCCLILAMIAATLPVQAQDVVVHGFADVRLVAAADQASWSRGGLGKTGYGSDHDGAHFGAGAIVAAWQISPAVLALVDVRYQSPDVAVAEAFVRLRPVSTSPLRWSIKAGEFFPMVSQENEGIGWTSLWTITPSSIDTWIGEELRVIGAEARAEYRGEGNTVELAVGLFQGNDPLGEILASRGWVLGDHVSGIGSRLREPDAYAALLNVEPPRRYDPFLEIDHRVGAYAELTFTSAPLGRISFTHYDNRADPSAYHVFDHGDELFAWRTKFDALGARTGTGRWVFLAQAMQGTTEIEPPFFASETHFASGYVLAGCTIGAWRPALRVEAFSTRQDPNSPTALSEHGHAATLALNWRPFEWLRLTGEALRVDSVRNQRLAIGLAPRQVDNQLMFNARLLF